MDIVYSKFKKILELNKDPRLTINGSIAYNGAASYAKGSRKYTKDEIQEIQKKQDEVTELLKDSIPGLTTFCNFTDDGVIRYLFNWNHNKPGLAFFEGVGYTSLDEFTVEVPV